MRQTLTSTLKALGLLMLTLAPLAGCESAGDGSEAPTSDATVVNYLAAHGTFLTQTAPDGWPQRMVLTTPLAAGSASTFSFYADTEGSVGLAESCAYQYNRSQPEANWDEEGTQPMWVMFELLDDADPECEAFRYVGFAFGVTGDLNLRFGKDSYDELSGATSDNPRTTWLSPFQASQDARTPRPYHYTEAGGSHVLEPGIASAARDGSLPSAIVADIGLDASDTTKMTFFDHDRPELVAAECGFRVRYTMPDPLSFPGDKLDVWDAYEMVESYEGDCEAFRFVTLNWASEPGRMLFRNGTDGFFELLGLSLDSSFNTARYCRPGATQGCSQ